MTAPLRDVDRWASVLHAAREQGRPVAPLTDEDPELSIDTAYAIARHDLAVRLSAGARLVGHKIGLTSAAVQRQLGVDQPDYGALLDVMQIADGAATDAGALIAPRVELEFAFHLAEALTGPDVTPDDVRRATDVVQPAIELVDSRIIDWRIRLADTVADNASSAGFVLGGRRSQLAELDLTDFKVELWRGDELVERGSSSAVLGDPCAAVAWLANALSGFGTSLEVGQVVLSGACTRMVPATPGDVFRGWFGALGDVVLSIAQEAS